MRMLTCVTALLFTLTITSANAQAPEPTDDDSGDTTAEATPEPMPPEPANEPEPTPIPVDEEPEKAPPPATPKPSGDEPEQVAETDVEPEPTDDAMPHGEDSETWEKLYKFGKMFSFSTVWYLHYKFGSVDDEAYNKFAVGRGYLTMKVKPAKWFESRITMDAHQDDSGDMKVRLKYLYGKFKIPVETKFVTEPNLEFGIVHMPWLDYEEHINWYRSQGTMFMERNKLFNSADFGATFGMLLGEKLDNEYQKEVSSKYPGKWGSLALGVYNGGGYHALEKNSPKSFDARLSLRPLGFIFPNLQLSYFVIVGRGNIAGIDGAKPPKWQSHTFMASIEHKYFALAGTFVMGEGNQKGSFTEFDTEIDPVTGEEIVTGIADVYDYMGASGFAELKLHKIKSSFIARYDYFNREDQKGVHRIIGGYAFHFFKMHKTFLMVDVDYIINEGATPDAWETKLTLQIKL